MHGQRAEMFGHTRELRRPTAAGKTLAHIRRFRKADRRFVKLQVRAEAAQPIEPVSLNLKPRLDPVLARARHCDGVHCTASGVFFY